MGTGDLTKGFFLDNLPLGDAFRWASLLLFLHVVVAFLIKQVVLARYLHSCMSPARSALKFSDEGGGWAHAEYAAYSLILLLAGFGVAVCVPFFEDLMGLTGALLSAPISYALPMIFYAAARAGAEARRRSKGLAPGTVGLRQCW